MEILLVSPETVPFSKSGGLADVVGALSKALEEMNIGVEVFMPFYPFIDKKGFKEIGTVSANTLSGSFDAKLYRVIKDKVSYVALDHPLFSMRDGIYGASSFQPYPDNAKRFYIFSLSALLYAEESGKDIVHANDWATGILPYLMNVRKSKAKSVYTIHNLAYQGNFSKYDALSFGIPLDDTLFEGKVGKERLNLMKAGILNADLVTTVSKTYAKEILTSEFGYGLEKYLGECSGRLIGITNGIDTNEWDPGKDKNLKHKFSSTSLEGKEKMKKLVLEENGLEYKKDRPLFAMISRLADQKGFSELLDGDDTLMEKILQEDISFILIGTGEKRFENKLKELEGRFSNFKANIIFDQKESHKLEAAADFFLMPSRYEPCGLNQMYSERYGALPIAHRTGGLEDTIVDVGENKDSGTGFLFEKMTSEEILSTVRKAIKFYNEDKDGYMAARKRGMNADFTWKKSAESYIEAYKSILGRKKK